MRYLEHWETPQNACEEGDVYIYHQKDGMYCVAYWDGSESFDYGEDSLFDTREEAEEAAQEWIDNRP